MAQVDAALGQSTSEGEGENGSGASGGDEGDTGGAVEVSPDITLKEIMSNLRGRGKKRTGVPMPSTVLRKEEARKKRRLTREEKRRRERNGEEPEEEEAAKMREVREAEEEAGKAKDNEKDAEKGNEEAGAGAGNDGGAGDGNDHDDDDDDDDNDDDVGVGEGGVVAPQVTIDDDGNIVIDKESLVVNAASLPSDGLGGGEVVTIDKDDFSRHVTSASFIKRTASTRWTEEDNDKFYESLSRFGTDFGLIELAFPNRSRRQIKLKFKREERSNLAKVNEYLSARIKLNLADARKEFGLSDKPPPAPVEAAATGSGSAAAGAVDRAEKVVDVTGDGSEKSSASEKDSDDDSEEEPLGLDRIHPAVGATKAGDGAESTPDIVPNPSAPASEPAAAPLSALESKVDEDSDDGEDFEDEVVYY